MMPKYPEKLILCSAAIQSYTGLKGYSKQWQNPCMNLALIPSELWLINKVNLRSVGIFNFIEYSTQVCL